MAHDVFISHSARDKPYADAICAKLESRGIRCWIAPRDVRPGMEWGAAIVEAVDGARVMLLVFSSQANSSPQISREVERAVHKGVIVIPVRVEDVKPAGNLEYFLGTPHWLDAITPPFERHLESIADSTKYWLDRLATDAAGSIGAGADRLKLETATTAMPRQVGGKAESCTYAWRRSSCPRSDRDRGRREAAHFRLTRPSDSRTNSFPGGSSSGEFLRGSKSGVFRRWHDR